MRFHFKFPKAAPVLWFDWWRGGRYPRRGTFETPNTDPPDAPNDVFYSLKGLGPVLWAEPHFARNRTDGFGESDTVEATVLGTARRQLADPASTGKQRSDAAAILAAWDEYQNRQEGATMAQATRSIHFTDEAPAGSQAVELVHADNLPAVPDAPTSIPAGALVGGAGISATRDGEGGPITVAIASKGVTAAMLADGVIPDPYTLPAASTTAIGGVKKAAAVPVVASADAAQAAGEAPTKAEFDALAALANENKKQLNALIAAGKAAGFLA